MEIGSPWRHGARNLIRHSRIIVPQTKNGWLWWKVCQEFGGIGFWGKEFTIRTDHAALREILTKKGEDFTPRQLRWWEKLEPYSFKVEYIKGQENVVPDALSRTPAFYVNALELTPQVGWVIGSQDLKDASLRDPKYQEVLEVPRDLGKVGTESKGGAPNHPPPTSVYAERCGVALQVDAGGT